MTSAVPPRNVPRTLRLTLRADCRDQPMPPLIFQPPPHEHQSPSLPSSLRSPRRDLVDLLHSPPAVPAKERRFPRVKEKIKNIVLVHRDMTRVIDNITYELSRRSSLRSGTVHSPSHSAVPRSPSRPQSGKEVPGHDGKVVQVMIDNIYAKQCALVSLRSELATITKVQKEKERLYNQLVNENALMEREMGAQSEKTTGLPVLGDGFADKNGQGCTSQRTQVFAYAPQSRPSSQTIIHEQAPATRRIQSSIDFHSPAKPGTGSSPQQRPSAPSTTVKHLLGVKADEQSGGFSALTKGVRLASQSSPQSPLKAPAAERLALSLKSKFSSQKPLCTLESAEELLPNHLLEDERRTSSKNICYVQRLESSSKAKSQDIYRSKPPMSARGRRANARPTLVINI